MFPFPGIYFENNPCYGNNFWPADPFGPYRFPAQRIPPDRPPEIPGQTPPTPADLLPPLPGQTQPTPADLLPPPSSVPESNPRTWAYKDIDSPGYPWRSPTLNRQNYPTPSMFFDANNPNGTFVFRGMEQFVRAALGSALVMAGSDPALATSNTDVGRSLRRQMLDAIQCSRFNDSLYGALSASLAGPQGRGISWDPKHADVFKLMFSGTPMRTIDLQGSRLPQFIEVNRRPLVLVPALRLAALTGSDPQVIAEPEPNYPVAMSGVQLPGGPGCVPPGPVSRGRGNAEDFWRRR